MFMLNSKEVIWDGPSIPCLQLCKGDTVSDVIYNIAKQVCCIIDDLDLKDLSYSCIIDKSRTYGNVDLFLFFSLLLENDCKIKDLLDAKIDANDTTELLVDSLDLKCFLQPYLDNICAIVRFYNQPGSEINPNHTETIFQRAEIENINYYYVSDIDQSVWKWDGIQYVIDNTDLNTVCVCELEDINLDVKSTLQVIIDNLCQTKTNGVIKACDTFKVVPFDTIDPNTLTTVFTGIPQEQTSYYISKITHKLWRWVSSENSYLPSILTTSNINLASIDSCLLNAEIALQNWVDLYRVYQEPTIKSCLAVDNILSNHITNITDKEICTLNSIVGSDSDIYYSFIGPCAKVVNFKFAPNSPFMALDPMIPNDPNYFYINKNYPYPFIWNGSLYVPYKETLANVERSQWEKVCDLLDRVKSLETICCTPSCDDIEVGFSSTYNYDDNIFTLTFDKASGTNIPEDYVDCGSILIATDRNGVKVSLDIELSQDAIIELDSSTLDLSQTVNVNIKSCLSNGTLTCKTCYSQSLPIIEKCGLCKICAVDSSDNGGENIIIYYTLASSPTTVQTNTLYGGQCITFSLPEDVPTIKSIVTSSTNITLENDPEYPCNDVEIPSPLGDSCWFFPLPTTSSPAKINVDRGLIPASFQMLPDFELRGESNDMHSFRYDKLYTYSNPNGIVLNGNIDTVYPDTTTGDVITWYNKLPDNILTADSSIKLAVICSDDGFEGKWITFGTYPIPKSLNSNGNAAFPAVGVSGSVDRNIDYTRVKKGTNKTGFVIKLNNQPINIEGIQKPEISLIDPISLNKVYIKGELLADDCNCPTI